MAFRLRRTLTANFDCGRRTLADGPTSRRRTKCEAYPISITSAVSFFSNTEIHACGSSLWEWFSAFPVLHCYCRQHVTFPVWLSSPRIRRARWMSFGMIVMRLAWSAHRFVSSKSEVRYASAASCNARMACVWKRTSVFIVCATSRTRRWNGSLRMRRSVDFWYFRISRSATVPGLSNHAIILSDKKIAEH